MLLVGIFSLGGKQAGSVNVYVTKNVKVFFIFIFYLIISPDSPKNQKQIG